MNLLIVINNLGCGGAQKSLVSFLNSLTKEQYDIDLLVLNKDDIFFDSVPEWVHFLPADNAIEDMHLPMKKMLSKRRPAKNILRCISAKFQMKGSRKQKYDAVQKLWRVWKKYIPTLDRKYDLAMSYVDGFSNYFVIDKVNAHKKLLWIHNEYEKLSYSSAFDHKYFEAADGLVTISQRCVDSLNRVFPEFSKKTYLLYNLSSPRMIWNMAGTIKPPEYREKENIIVSIGRLNEQKGFDLAVQAASVMKKQGVSFVWFVIGEGEQEKILKEMILNGKLEQQFCLIGVRKNPYPYLAFADIVVQPSRYEGKSIVLDEAKILQKPIIATDYATVYDSLENGVNGEIVPFDAEKLADAAQKLLSDKELQHKYSSRLSLEHERTSDGVQSYTNLISHICNGGEGNAL